MKRISLICGVALAAAALAQSAAPAVQPLAAHQEPRGIGNLVAPGDRVEIVYSVDTPHVRSPKGSLYVRNDLQRRFTALPLKLDGKTTVQARVPARLIRGHKLLYYAVLREPRSGRSVTIPALGAAAPQSALVLGKAIVVRLGTHRFDQPRSPDAVVARASAADVGFENNQEYHFGPQTFLVGRDGSILLHDGLKQRLLVWKPGRPDVFERSVSLPFFAGDNDVALGRDGSLYVVRAMGKGPSSYMALSHLNANGEVLWQSRLAGQIRESRHLHARQQQRASRGARRDRLLPGGHVQSPRRRARVDARRHTNGSAAVNGRPAGRCPLALPARRRWPTPRVRGVHGRGHGQGRHGPARGSLRPGRSAWPRRSSLAGAEPDRHQLRLHDARARRPRPGCSSRRDGADKGRVQMGARRATARADRHARTLLARPWRLGRRPPGRPTRGP